MNIPERTIIVEAFWTEFASRPFELVEGKVIEASPSGGLHGAVTRRVGMLLGGFVDEHELGEVFGAETGFHLTDDTIRAADSAFVHQQRWAVEKIRTISVPIHVFVAYVETMFSERCKLRILCIWFDCGCVYTELRTKYF